MSDYLPYGKIAYESVPTNTNNNYRYTGKELDSENSLSYFGARYYDQAVGRFTSIDPVMLGIASDERVKQKTGAKQQQLLSDPQSLNNYAYARNNPVILFDPDGKWWKEVITGRQSFADFNIELGQAAQQLYDTSNVWKNAMDHPVATGVVVGVASGAAAYGAAAGATALSTQYLGGLGTGCIAFCGQLGNAQKILESGRGWSPGSTLDSAKNVVSHFKDHAKDFNVRSIQEYYNRANEFIDSKLYNYSWKEGTDTVFFNSTNNVINIINKSEQIKSFYQVTDPGKLRHIYNIIDKLSN